MRNGEARRTGNKTECPLVGQVIHLVHHAIDVIRQVFPRRRHFRIVSGQAGCAAHHGTLAGDRQAPANQTIQQLTVKSRRW